LGQATWICGPGSWEREIRKTGDTWVSSRSARGWCRGGSFAIPSKECFSLATFEPTESSLGLCDNILGKAFGTESLVFKDGFFSFTKSFECLCKSKKGSSAGEGFRGLLTGGSIIIGGLLEVLIRNGSVDVPLLKRLGHVGIARSEFGPSTGRSVRKIAGNGF
jgi:hypothetical protein